VHAVEVDQALLRLNKPNLFQIDRFVDTADDLLRRSYALVFDFLSRKQILVGEECKKINTLGAILIILALANRFYILINCLDHNFQ